ncbi:TPA: HNH endonuclease [Enterobacter cancerogenus]|nr:HNH endonuclease [Enterobacter cancerogenus]HDR2165891.1 HNH endonuclease [Enterobacter cancerogenus]HDR2268549.1 HNH endonuclease [Enterobacter cancerogenus]
MFQLYHAHDLSSRLIPDNFRHILSPHEAMKLACIHYDLSPSRFGFGLLSELPPRNLSPSFESHYHSGFGIDEGPVYREIKRHLEMGTLFGVDTSRRWSRVSNPFFIDEDGELIFSPHSAFVKFPWGMESTVRNAYQQARTLHPFHEQWIPDDDFPPPAAPVSAGRTLNSKNVGRLLAAGGVYNGNVEEFRKTAEQLGGDAVSGYDSVLNEITSGMMIAAASVLAIRKPMAADDLTQYIGKYKKAHVLLDDMQVTQLNYLRRDRAEYMLLRKEFDKSVRPEFLKSLSRHPDAISTFDSDALLRLADGKVPAGWQVHHKIPLDDGGTNALENLVLIKNSPYHSALTKTQAVITKDLPYNASKDVLWPAPKGVIYPVGK